MTRYHYIKKLMYLQYRLLMLPTCMNHRYCTSYATWNSRIPYLPFANGSQTYQEDWDRTCKELRRIKGLKDLK